MEPGRLAAHARAHCARNGARGRLQDRQFGRAWRWSAGSWRRLDDDPIAIRSALWSATDQAYKAALAAYAQKQAALKQVQTPPQAEDFSHEKALISLAEPVSLKVDADALD